MHPSTIGLLLLIFMAGLAFGVGLGMFWAMRKFFTAQQKLSQTQADMNKVLADINLKFAAIAQQASQFRAMQHYPGR